MNGDLTPSVNVSRRQRVLACLPFRLRTSLSSPSLSSRSSQNITSSTAQTLSSTSTQAVPSNIALIVFPLRRQGISPWLHTNAIRSYYAFSPSRSSKAKDREEISLCVIPCFCRFADMISFSSTVICATPEQYHSLEVDRFLSCEEIAMDNAILKQQHYQYPPGAPIHPSDHLPYCPNLKIFKSGPRQPRVDGQTVKTQRSFSKLFFKIHPKSCATVFA